MKKTKVLHVPFGGLGRGGVSSVIFSIVENLYTEIEFDSVVFKKRCERENEFQKYGNLYRINAYNVNSKRNIFELLSRPFKLTFGIYKICKNNQYDVIHCHNGADQGFCLLAAKLAKVPIRVSHAHNTASPQKKNFIIRLYEKLGKILIRNTATNFVGCSGEACKYFFGNDIKYDVILNAINMDRFDIKRRKEHKGLNFIHVGRYTYQKNQEKVLSIFNELRLFYPNSKLYLVGFGEDEYYLKNLISELELEKFVEMIPGNEIDVSTIYEIGDYMIFPSRFEGFGIVLIEAQAMGVYCFVSDKIQKEADAGLLSVIDLSKTSIDWAKQIKNIIDTRKNINNVVSISKYSIAVIANQYKTLYMKGKV